MAFNPYFAIILAALIGATTGVFVKLINLPATTLSFFRTAVPIITLLFYFAYKKRNLIRGNWKIMLFASGLNALRMLLYFVAFLYINISYGIITLFTWPIFATLFSIFFLGECVTKRTIILLSLAFLGIILIYADAQFLLQKKEMLGLIAMLFSAMIYAVTVLIFKKELSNYTLTETIFYQNIVGAVVFLPFLFTYPLPTITQATVTAGYAFLIGIIAFFLFFYALKRINISHYSLLSYCEVPAAVLFGVLFFNETATVSMVLGGSLIIVAGLLLRKEG